MRLFMYPARRDDRQPTLIRAVPLALGMLIASAAQAQSSATVSLASELSVRGVSLSDGRPAPQVGWSYDGEQGWYAGAVAAAQVRVGERDNAIQLIAYGGYARLLASGLSWEAGVSSTVFRHAADYNYREAYVGLASDRVNGRLYFAPAYYGYGGRVTYAEINTFHPLRDHLKLIAHAGLRHHLQDRHGGARDHLDVRLALGYDAGSCNLQLAWLGGSGIGPAAASGSRRAPRTMAISASTSF